MEVLEGAPVVERPVVVEEEEKGPVPIAHQESVSSLGTMATDSTDPPDAAPVVVKATLSPAWCASLDILAAIQQKYFHIETNEFRGRTNGRTGQDEAMICDCSFDPHADLKASACGPLSDCINHTLCIECHEETCPAEAHCQNQRFQKKQYAPIQVFDAGLKGFGIRLLQPIDRDDFVIEYCGEVISQSQFQKRKKEYHKSGLNHFYFMSLKSNEYIDATKKGNISRFVNHSCEPNCVLQKWVVGSRIRIGLFAIKDIPAGTELTFDYKFENYGQKAQPCYCGESVCTGFIGGATKSQGIVDELLADEEIEEEDDPDTSDDETGGERKPRHKKTKEEEEEEYATRKRNIKSLATPEDVVNLARIMFRSSLTPKKMTLYLERLIKTESQSLLRKFIACHGVIILKHCVSAYEKKGNFDIVLMSLQILKILPITSKNSVEKIMEVIETLATSINPSISMVSRELYEKWKDLPMMYKIPKRSITDAFKTEEGNSVSSFHSFTVDSANGPRTMSLMNIEARKASLVSYTTATAEKEQGTPVPMGRYSSQKKDSPSSDINGRTSETYDRRKYDDRKPPESSSFSRKRDRSRSTSRSRDLDRGRNYTESPGKMSDRSYSRDRRYRDRSYSRSRSRERSYSRSPEKNGLDRISGGLPPVPTPPTFVDYEFYEFEDEKKPDPAKGKDRSKQRRKSDQRKSDHKKSKDKGEKSKSSSSAPVAGSSHNSSSSSQLKKVKAEMSKIVIGVMSRFKTQVPPEKFKTMAKKVTETLVDKEMRAKKVKHFTGLDDKSKKGAKKWVMEYMTRHGYKPVGKEKGGEDEKDEGDDVEGEADMEVDTTPQDQDDGAADSSVESDLGEQVGASDLERSSPQKPPLPVSDGLSQEDFN